MMRTCPAVLWNTIKTTFGISFVALLIYAGYTIVTALLPMGASSNAIMRKASDVLTHDPDVHTHFGTIKTYGADAGGGGTEGRRYFVPEYKYEDKYTGEKCVHRSLGDFPEMRFCRRAASGLDCCVRTACHSECTHCTESTHLHATQAP